MKTATDLPFDWTGINGTTVPLGIDETDVARSLQVDFFRATGTARRPITPWHFISATTDGTGFATHFGVSSQTPLASMYEHVNTDLDDFVAVYQDAIEAFATELSDLGCESPYEQAFATLGRGLHGIVAEEPISEELGGTKDFGDEKLGIDFRALGFTFTVKKAARKRPWHYSNIESADFLITWKLDEDKNLRLGCEPTRKDWNPRNIIAYKCGE